MLSNLVLAIFLLVQVMSTKTMSQDILINGFKLPLLTLCHQYTLLLDTGSKDTWIADHSCKDCLQTANVCPQSHSITQQIKYFKGSVKGDISYLNTCLGSYKIVCAIQTQEMQSVGAMGILGMRGNSTGKNILKALLQNNNIEQKSFSLYYGFKENLIFFGEIPSIFMKQEIKVRQGSQQWQIKQAKMVFWGKQIVEQTHHQIFIDTGSNMLILPSSVHQQVRSHLNSQMSKMDCLGQGEPLQYLCPSSFVLQETVRFQLAHNSFLQIQLAKTITAREGRVKFLISSNDDKAIVIGGSILRDYIIQFDLQGRIKIFTTNKEQLSRKEISNFKILFMEYIAIVLILSLTSYKLYQIAERTFNRKIVI